MVAGILDTSVIVDLLRLHRPASSWLSRQLRLGVSPIVWLEIIEGARDSRALSQAVRLLHHFTRLELLPADVDWAIEQALQFKLSHNIGSDDCLIAATAHRLGVPLYTTNLKHFLPILGPLAQRPY